MTRTAVSDACDCFSLPAQFTFGNSGRNTVIAPGYADVDLALENFGRIFSAGPTRQMQFGIKVIF